VHTAAGSSVFVVTFDRIAPWYRALEYLTFGRALERRRFEYLDELSAARRVLILGDGDGRFTARLTAHNPDVQIDSVDLSARMLDLARGRIGPNGRVNLLHADARTFEPCGCYDAIVTHFFLDCLTNAETQTLLARLSKALRPGGQWIVSEFQIPDAGPMRFIARAIVSALYLAFRILTGLRVNRLPGHGAALSAHGFRRHQFRKAAGGLLISELWKLNESSASCDSCNPSTDTDPDCTAS
jgi:ubiquinone/menaquinone biosynthesis C-methylase UbiE